MKQDNELEIPVGVSLTHDHGNPIIFAYVGGGRGRLGMESQAIQSAGDREPGAGTQAGDPLEKASPEGTHGSGGGPARASETEGG